jgi:hypothetical protein
MLRVLLNNGTKEQSDFRNLSARFGVVGQERSGVFRRVNSKD